MVMACAAGIKTWQDRPKTIAARGISMNMATVAVAEIVIIPVFVGMPKDQKRDRNRPAKRCQHLALELENATRGSGLDKVSPFRRKRLEEWALNLGFGGVVISAAFPAPRR